MTADAGLTAARPTPAGFASEVLAEEEWHRRRDEHQARVAGWTADRLSRRRQARTHPVDDFLFDYYSYRPGQLRQWHPGLGTVLAGPSALRYLERPRYLPVTGGVAVDPALAAARADRLRWVRDLLSRTGARPPAFGCFGLHEWAMVYRLDPGLVRHPAWPLRLAADEVAATVESQGLRCTHLDAFRFFTPDAVPLNATRLTREGQPLQEQAGCLHVTMDLYKWAYKLSPLVSSEVVADCFALAREVRTVDMQASPYDLSGLGLAPIAVETPEGRAEYVERQRDFTRRAQPLRRRLLAGYDRALAATGGPGR